MNLSDDEHGSNNDNNNNNDEDRMNVYASDDSWDDDGDNPTKIISKQEKKRQRMHDAIRRAWQSANSNAYMDLSAALEEVKNLLKIDQWDTTNIMPKFVVKYLSKIRIIINDASLESEENEKEKRALKKLKKMTKTKNRYPIHAQIGLYASKPQFWSTPESDSEIELGSDGEMSEEEEDDGGLGIGNLIQDAAGSDDANYEDEDGADSSDRENDNGSGDDNAFAFDNEDDGDENAGSGSGGGGSGDGSGSAEDNEENEKQALSDHSDGDGDDNEEAENNNNNNNTNDGDGDADESDYDWGSASEDEWPEMEARGGAADPQASSAQTSDGLMDIFGDELVAQMKQRSFWLKAPEKTSEEKQAEKKNKPLSEKKQRRLERAQKRLEEERERKKKDLEEANNDINDDNDNVHQNKNANNTAAQPSVVDSDDSAQQSKTAPQKPNASKSKQNQKSGGLSAINEETPDDNDADADEDADDAVVNEEPRNDDGDARNQRRLKSIADKLELHNQTRTTFADLTMEQKKLIKFARKKKSTQYKKKSEVKQRSQLKIEVWRIGKIKSTFAEVLASRNKSSANRPQIIKTLDSIITQCELHQCVQARLTAISILINFLFDISMRKEVGMAGERWRKTYQLMFQLLQALMQNRELRMSNYADVKLIMTEDDMERELLEAEKKSENRRLAFLQALNSSVNDAAAQQNDNDGDDGREEEDGNNNRNRRGRGGSSFGNKGNQRNEESSGANASGERKIGTADENVAVSILTNNQIVLDDAYTWIHGNLWAFIKRLKSQLFINLKSLKIGTVQYTKRERDIRLLLLLLKKCKLYFYQTLKETHISAYICTMCMSLSYYKYEESLDGLKLQIDGMRKTIEVKDGLVKAARNKSKQLRRETKAALLKASKNKVAVAADAGGGGREEKMAKESEKKNAHSSSETEEVDVKDDTKEEVKDEHNDGDDDGNEAGAKSTSSSPSKSSSSSKAQNEKPKPLTKAELKKARMEEIKKYEAEQRMNRKIAYALIDETQEVLDKSSRKSPKKNASTVEMAAEAAQDAKDTHISALYAVAKPVKTENLLFEGQQILQLPSCDLVRLAQFIFEHGTTKMQTEAMLYLIFSMALHNRFELCRDLILMSHLGSAERIGKNSVELQILYNRTIARFAICAFIQGHWLSCMIVLQELYSSGNIKILLGQGIRRAPMNNPSIDQIKTAEIQKRRQLPSHLYLNVDTLECCHLLSSVFIEVPSMVINSDLMNNNRRQSRNRHFRRTWENYFKRDLRMLPENTSSLILTTGIHMQCGKYDKCLALVRRLKLWNNIRHSFFVKHKVINKLRLECMKCYLYQFGSVYKTISISKLASMFDLKDTVCKSYICQMLLPGRDERLPGSLDEISNCLIIHQQPPKPIQRIALEYGNKLSFFIEQNERLLGVYNRFQARNQSFNKNKGQRWKNFSGGGGKNAGNKGGQSGNQRGGRPRGVKSGGFTNRVSGGKPSNMNAGKKSQRVQIRLGFAGRMKK